MEDADQVANDLLEAGLLTVQQKEQVLGMVKQIGGTVGQVALKLGFFEEDRWVDFLSALHNLEIADISDLIIPENLVKRIPRKLIERHCVLPIAFRKGTLTVATPDPNDFAALEEVRMAVDARLMVRVARRSELQKAINDLFYGEGGGVQAQGDSTVASAVARQRGMANALIPLLIEKGLITEQELALKARELGIGLPPAPSE